MLDQRGQLLRAALGFAGCSMLSYDRALHALRTWLDSWSAIGPRRRGDAPPGLRSAVDSVRRERLACDVYTTGMEHSSTSATGTGWERTPWHATQRAAWEALRKARY
jgi:hypothetical protein